MSCEVSHIAVLFTRNILLENQQNSTHKKKRYKHIHIYTEEKKPYNKPTTNILSLAIYIK